VGVPPAPGPRTAGFDQLDPRQAAVETLTDPETDALAVRREDGTVLAAVPQRLPATSPLAELILDRPVWVRTADGTLYLAPKDAYWGPRAPAGRTRRPALAPPVGLSRCWPSNPGGTGREENRRSGDRTPASLHWVLFTASVLVLARPVRG
jgi:hypothetical protein